jgi:hypothetical protein
LAALPRAALMVEDRYSQVFTLQRVRPAVVADGLAELQVRWPPEIIAAHPGGRRDLYVALIRATRRVCTIVRS